MSNTAEWLYGARLLEELLTHKPEALVRVYFEDGRAKEYAQAIQELRAQGIPYETVPGRTMERWLPGRTHQGIALHCAPLQPRSEKQLLQEIAAANGRMRILILDSLEDPRNLGSCFRTAAVVGIKALVLPKGRGVAVNQTVRQVARGGAELIPWVEAPNLVRCMESLKEAGFWIYGLSHEGTEDLYEVAWPDRVALVVGNEGSGLRQLTKKYCDSLLTIGGSGPLKVLNASVACALALFAAH